MRSRRCLRIQASGLSIRGRQRGAHQRSWDAHSASPTPATPGFNPHPAVGPGAPVAPYLALQAVNPVGHKQQDDQSYPRAGDSVFWFVRIGHPQHDCGCGWRRALPLAVRDIASLTRITAQAAGSDPSPCGTRLYAGQGRIRGRSYPRGSIGRQPGNRLPAGSAPASASPPARRSGGVLGSVGLPAFGCGSRIWRQDGGSA